jgi:hypothetical protein
MWNYITIVKVFQLIDPHINLHGSVSPITDNKHNSHSVTLNLHLHLSLICSTSSLSKPLCLCLCRSNKVLHFSFYIALVSNRLCVHFSFHFCLFVLSFSFLRISQFSGHRWSCFVLYVLMLLRWKTSQ